MTDRAKRALITGITGQDGSYLAELLLDKGLRGARRHPPLQQLQHRSRSTTSTTTRTRPASRFILHYGDLTDASSRSIN